MPFCKILNVNWSCEIQTKLQENKNLGSPRIPLKMTCQNEIFLNILKVKDKTSVTQRYLIYFAQNKQLTIRKLSYKRMFCFRQ